MVDWFCEKCPANKNEDCGPFQDDSSLFPRIKSFHNGHPGWKEGQPTLTQPVLIPIELAPTLAPILAPPEVFNSMIEEVCAIACQAEQKTKQREQEKGNAITQILAYLNSVIKNDSELVKKLVHVCLSAYTNNPINLGIMADSSEGKTYAAIKVTEIFPDQDVIVVGRMSPTALIHQRGILVDPQGNPIEERIKGLELDEENKKESKQEIKELLRSSVNVVDLSRKILLFLEPPNTTLWDNLKPILSHDKYEIKYKTTQTDGSLRVKESVIRGFPAVIFCSARNEASNPIWQEIETRFDICSPNTETKKYKEANKYTSQKLGTPGFAKDLIQDAEEEKYAKFYASQIKDDICKLCENNDNPIWNPFHGVIGESFPSNQGITMRQCNRFLAYCNISTLIHSRERFKIEFETRDGKIAYHPITDLQDVDEAICLVGTVSVIPPERLKFFKDVFEPALKEVLLDSLGVTSEKLAKKYTAVYGKETTSKKILENYLEPLMDYGVIEAAEDHLDRRRYLYRTSSKLNTNGLEIIRSRIIEQSNNDDLFVWHYIDKLEKCSIKLGKIRAILDPCGYPEGWNLIQKQIVREKSNNLPEAQA